MGYCHWDNASSIDRAYHNQEWGLPLHNDYKQFEYLMLEVMQSGLSWELMLKKRSIFNKCFANFDYNKIAAYTEQDIVTILNTAGMIRSERKIRAVINNARCFLQIRAEFGSFSAYLWNYSGGKSILYTGHAEGNIPVSNGLSSRISKDLRRRGFKFLGSITVYSHLQACGIINDHESDCPRYSYINSHFPTVTLPPDDEIF